MVAIPWNDDQIEGDEDPPRLEDFLRGTPPEGWIVELDTDDPTSADWIETGVRGTYTYVGAPYGDRFGAPLRYRIDAHGAALWAASKLQAAQTRYDEHVAAAVEQRARIDRWLAGANEKPMHDIEFFAGLIAEWHERQVAEEIGRPPVGRISDAEWKRVTKTVDLIDAKSSARRGQGQFTTADVDAAIEWLRENSPDLLHWTPTVRAFEMENTPGRVELDADGRYWLVTVVLDTDEVTSSMVTVDDVMGEAAVESFLGEHFDSYVRLVPRYDEGGTRVAAHVEGLAKIPGIVKAGRGELTMKAEPAVKAKRS